MTMQDNPVPTTSYEQPRAKVSDGKSVRVAVPERTTIEAQKFYELDGFFGASFDSVTTIAGQHDEEVILNIEQAEYETDQIDGRKSYNAGDALYFDGDKLTPDATATEEVPDAEPIVTANRLVGRVTKTKDENGVIWFILGPQR